MSEHALHAAAIDVAPDDVRARHGRGEIALVDVRDPDEHEAGRIAGAAHLPLAELPARAGEIGHERPVVFYCRVGARSALAARAFRRAGWEAYTMTGGLEAWVRHGLPLEPEDGYVAPH